MSLTLKRAGRSNSEMRQVTIECGMAPNAEGSALIAFGDTRVWCTASVDEQVPAWLAGSGSGWVTAEYSMLPRSTSSRIQRNRGTNSGRSREISRLIGRSLRASLDFKRLGPRMITIDCDVLQADGGTRTAAITGGYVALSLAVKSLIETNTLKRSPIVSRVAAISAGIVAGEPRLDLNYAEDSKADVDLNLVMDSRGKIIEIQGSAEGATFSRDQLSAMLDLAEPGIHYLSSLQAEAISNAS